MFAPRQFPTHAYSNVHAETSVHGADRHQLISLLLDGALSAIAGAVSAIERDDASAKRRAISRAVGIVDEGLRSVLDHARRRRGRQHAAQPLFVHCRAADAGQCEQRLRHAA